MTKKPKYIPWSELKDNKCPNCKQELQKGMFDDPYTACPGCGFLIMDDTRDLLVNRDHNNTPKA